MGRPKAGLVVGGTTLVERAVAIAREAGCRPVAVVARSDTPLPAGLGAPVIHDPPGDQGPLAAISVGLEWLIAEVSRQAGEQPGEDDFDVVVLACDLPAAAPVVQRLVAAAPGRPLVARDPGGRLQPLCCRLPARAALGAARSALAGGQRRVGVLADDLRAEVIDATAAELHNLNHPTDLP